MTRNISDIYNKIINVSTSLFKKNTRIASSSLKKLFLFSVPVVLGTSITALANNDYNYNPSIDLSGKYSKARNIGELNYMHPLTNSGSSLPIIDLKLKSDNQKSKEVNLGIAYRYNNNDKAIFGSYAYFDYRQVTSAFGVKELTIGSEILTKYLDLRANIYIPETKRKRVSGSDSIVGQVRNGNIYIGSDDEKYQTAMSGYDIEVGFPIFAFSDKLNNKFNTKLNIAKYTFKGKSTKTMDGTRFRLEQDLLKAWSNNNSYNFYLNIENQYDNIRKQQNFIAVGLKIIFNDQENYGKNDKNSLSHRMMDTIIRDVDAVVASDRYKGTTLVNSAISKTSKDMFNDGSFIVTTEDNQKIYLDSKNNNIKLVNRDISITTEPTQFNNLHQEVKKIYSLSTITKTLIKFNQKLKDNRASSNLNKTSYHTPSPSEEVALPLYIATIDMTDEERAHTVKELVSSCTIPATKDLKDGLYGLLFNNNPEDFQKNSALFINSIKVLNNEEDITNTIWNIEMKVENASVSEDLKVRYLNVMSKNGWNKIEKITNTRFTAVVPSDVRIPNKLIRNSPSPKSVSSQRIFTFE